MNDSFINEPVIMSTADLLESAAAAVVVAKCDSKNDLEAITTKFLLKNLLTASSPSPTALLTTVTVASSTETNVSIVTTSPTITPSSIASTESMITKEINDTQLNLTKILYEPDKHDVVDAKEKNNYIVDSQVDDDDRLVIDISDDEKREKRKKRATNKGKILDDNQLPRSITYCLEPSSLTGVSNSVKIDILASCTSEVTSTTTMNKSTSNSPVKVNHQVNISVSDELNLLGHEIDRQMNKKANEILELLKAFLIGGAFSQSNFRDKMNEIGNVTMSDLIMIAKKVIKRHKFEMNPNHHYFVKMKNLQFPTSARDLVNYFEKLLPSVNREKFISMIKFYEIIIKEMLNLNRTKILQYLIDFMIKRKNSQLDLLNFNYLATTGPIIERSSPSMSQVEIPDSTQQPPSEKKPMKFLDTSYNFVLRSDPIYIMACSKFQTNIRNVIRCRCSTCAQEHNFERRPFDNNILRNRRIGKRLVSEREDVMLIREHQQQYHTIPLEKIKKYTEFKQTRLQNNTPLKIQNSSPILVESDTPPPSENSSPPAVIQHPLPPASIKVSQHEKPQIISQLFLQRAFSEMPSDTTNTSALSRIISSTHAAKELPKIDFPKISSDTPLSNQQNIMIKQPVKRRPSLRSIDFSSTQVITNEKSSDAVQHITINELKTLTENGTEIIPTSIVKNKITLRRKTVDDRSQMMKTSAANVELRKITPLPQISEPIKSTAQSAHKTHMKRRQSCHDRIFVPSTSTPNNESHLSKNYLNFLQNSFAQKDNEEIRNRQLQQQQQQALYATAKRVRFTNEKEISQSRSVPIHSTSHQQNSLQQKSPILYQQQHSKFVMGTLRDRGYVDRVESINDQPTEIVSTIPPERYFTSQQQQQHQANLTSPKLARIFSDKSPRISQQRTSIVTNDEKMKIIAYQQLQSLRDSTTLGPHQYAEHLKSLHQAKQSPVFTSTNSSNFLHRPHSQDPPSARENYYRSNTLPEIISSSGSIHYSSSSTSAITTPSTMYSTISAYEQNQSLQKKLQLKAKSSVYVEPNQLSKHFYNPPNSTYYSDPYAPTVSNKAVHVSPTPAASVSKSSTPTAFHPPLNQSLSSSPQFTRNYIAPLQYQWMYQQQQHQSMHPNQPARPIPIQRMANISAFTDPKNISTAAFQAYHHHQQQQQQHEQQHTEYYRQLYQQHHPHHPKNF